MSFPFLFRKEIEDEYAQENFRRIGDFYASDPFTRSNFEFITITTSGAVTNYKFPHRLGFQPLDVIMTHNLNNVTVTFNYSKFDSVNLDITTSGATTLRLFVGRYI